jgi:hypothetical protein
MPYVVPFVVFAVLTYCGPILGISLLILYPVKTLLTAACLLGLRRTFRPEIQVRMDWMAVLAGVLVFLAWVGLDGVYPQFDKAVALPADSESIYKNTVFLLFRLVGAVLVVPIMEELFWRSFALRFLTDFDFLKVPLGHFSWYSFVAISLAFGFEHHEWLPGVIAGAAYALVLYRTRNLFSSILSHGVTNLLLGIYVMVTGKWAFW